MSHEEFVTGTLLSFAQKVSSKKKCKVSGMSGKGAAVIAIIEVLAKRALSWSSCPLYGIVSSCLEYVFKI